MAASAFKSCREREISSLTIKWKSLPSFWLCQPGAYAACLKTNNNLWKNAKNSLDYADHLGLDGCTGKDWWQDEKVVTEDKTVGWHQWLNGHWGNSGSQWRTGKPSMLQSMGSQKVRHDWGTEQQWGTQNRLWRTKSPTRIEKKEYTHCHMNAITVFFLFAKAPEDVTWKYSLFLLNVWLYFFLLTLASLRFNHLLLQTCLRWVSI